MSPALIGAYAAAAVAIIGAVFAGLAQLRHVKTYHSQAGRAYPAAGSPPRSPRHSSP